MEPSALTEREFVPGTTGWSVDDLDDPKIDRLWEGGAYELVEGVLVKIPAAYYDGGVALQNLAWIVRRSEAIGRSRPFATEADLILTRRRIARVDAVGVRNYWILNAFIKSLQCLVFDKGAYRVDQLGSGGDSVQPAFFPGLVISLSEIWP